MAATAQDTVGAAKDAADTAAAAAAAAAADDDDDDDKASPGVHQGKVKTFMRRSSRCRQGRRSCIVVIMGFEFPRTSFACVSVGVIVCTDLVFLS